MGGWAKRGLKSASRRRRESWTCGITGVVIIRISTSWGIGFICAAYQRQPEAVLGCPAAFAEGSPRPSMTNLHDRLVANISLSDAQRICQSGMARVVGLLSVREFQPDSLQGTPQRLSGVLAVLTLRKYRRQRRPVPWRVLRVHLAAGDESKPRPPQVSFLIYCGRDRSSLSLV